MSTALAEKHLNSSMPSEKVGVVPPARSALSGRPTCLIYRVDRWWVLELDRIGAWIEGALFPGVFHTFRSLSLAVGFAESRGLDYRIIHPKPLFLAKRRKRIGRIRPERNERPTLPSTH